MYLLLLCFHPQNQHPCLVYWNWVKAEDKSSQTDGHPKIPIQNLNLLQDCLNNQVLESFLSHVFTFSIFLFFCNTIFSLLLLGMGLLRMILSYYYNFLMLSITFGSSIQKINQLNKKCHIIFVKKPCEKEWTGNAAKRFL